MLDVTNALARPAFGKIVWNRIGIALSVLIIVGASITLTRLIREIDVEKVIEALWARSLQTTLIAMGFVVAGYITLTFYDFFALRTIGRSNVPYRIAALASFTSYSIGHNLGATVVTGGAIRFRIYSLWGLGVVDIAKIAFVTGLTFWLGNSFVLGVGLAYAPEAAGAVDQLSPWVNRAIGLTGLAFIAGYLIWLLPQPRAIGRGPWRVVLPNAALTLVQIGIGVLDLGAGALAMYTLLPASPSIAFSTLLVIFVAATLLGFLSNAPGSLGVFEAAMLIALPQLQIEELLASLLAFRMLYFVLPLMFAALALGLREVWLAVWPAGRHTD